VGDRFPAEVKLAIIQTLSKLLGKGGPMLRPFLPQLQTTFVKALYNENHGVRKCASMALGQLIVMSTRVDPVVNEMCQGAVSDAPNVTDGVRIALLDALKLVLSNRGDKVGEAYVNKCLDELPQLLAHADEFVRKNAAKTIAAALKLVKEEDTHDRIIETLVGPLKSATDWAQGHGICACIGAALVTTPFAMRAEPEVVGCINVLLKDDNVMIRQAAVDALAQLLIAQSKGEHSDDIGITDQLTQLLGMFQDSSGDIRHRALLVFKSFVKKCPGAVRDQLPVVAPALIACVRSERNITERCLVYAFELINRPETLKAFTSSRPSGVDSATIKQISEYCKRLVSRGAAEESDSEDVLEF